MLCNYAVSIFIYCYAEYHYAVCRYAECHYAVCRYAECHYAVCRYAECHGVILITSFLVIYEIFKVLLLQIWITWRKFLRKLLCQENDMIESGKDMYEVAEPFSFLFICLLIFFHEMWTSLSPSMNNVIIVVCTINISCIPAYFSITVQA